MDIRQLILTASMLLTVAACGGGGGGDGSSPPANNPSPVVQPDENYTGSTTRASVDMIQAHEWTYHVTTVSDVVNVLSFSDERRFQRFDALTLEYEQTYVGECESGSVTIIQTSDDSAAVTYSNCQSGPYLINGEGTFEIIEITSNGDVREGNLEYSNLAISNSFTSEDYLFTGTINVSYGNATSGTYEGTLISQTSGLAYWLNNFFVEENYEISNLLYRFSGRLFVSTLGYVDVSANLDLHNQIASSETAVPALQIRGRNTLRVTPVEQTGLELKLFSPSQEMIAASQPIPYGFIANQNYKQVQNTSPTIVLTEPVTSADKNVTTTFNADSTTDSDFDLIAFSWQVLTSPAGSNPILDGSQTNQLSFSASIAGDYQIQLSATDGVDTSQQTFNFRVLQNPANVTLSASHAELQLGELVTINVTTSNPDDDGPFDTVMHFGPPGMSMNENNELVWEAFIPQMGQDIVVNYGVSVSNQDRETIEKGQFVVKASSAGPALFVPSYVGYIIGWFDFNGDGTADMLSTNHGVLMGWDVSSGALQEIFTFRGEVEAFDINFAAFDPILKTVYVAGDDGIYYQFNLVQGTGSKFIDVPTNNASGRFASATIADLDNDGALELITNRNVIEIATGQVLASSEEYSRGTVNILDADNDGDNEILVGNILYDHQFKYITSTDVNDSGSSISNLVFDIDGDGAEEIIVLQNSLKIFDFIDGDLVLRQTLLDNEPLISRLSAVASSNFDTLYLSSDSGTLVTQFTLGDDGMYSNSGQMPLDDERLYKTSSDSAVFATCTLHSTIEINENSQLISSCHINALNNWSGERELITFTFNDSGTTLPVGTNIGLKLSNSPTITQQANGDIKHRVAWGVGTVTLDNQVEYATATPGTAIGNSYIRFNYFTVSDNDILGIDYKIISNRMHLYTFDLNGNEIDVVDTGQRNGHIKEVLRLNGEEYLVTATYNSIQLWALPQLEMLHQIETLEEQTQINAVTIFKVAGQEKAALWFGSDLLILSNDAPGMRVEYQISVPDDFSSPDLSIMSALRYNENLVIALLAANRNGAKRALVNLDAGSLEVQESSIDLLSTSINQGDNCSSKMTNSGRIIYSTSNQLAVDEADVNDTRRQYRLVAHDILSDEVIWKSNKLPGGPSYPMRIFCSLKQERDRLMINMPAGLFMLE